MDTTITNALPELHLAQIAWVVKDIDVTLKFFSETLGIKNFSKIQTISVKEFDATYYDQPSDATSLVAMAYSGGTFIELIQPLSGNSVFRDYLEKNPAGGLQHIAYRLPVNQLDKVISEYEKKGYPVISSFDTPIAKIVFFDTSKETGIMTEIMGITKEGEEVIEKMKAI